VFLDPERVLSPIAEASNEGSESRSWTGNTPAPSMTGDDGREPPSYEGSVHSVLTEHYLAQVQDREERQCVRRNIEWLRDNGFTVKGKLINGKYCISFFTEDGNPPVMSLKQIVKFWLTPTTTRRGPPRK